MLSEISLALDGIKLALEAGKFILDSKQSVEQAAVQAKIVDMLTALTESKLKLIETAEIIIKKDQELADLREVLKVKDSVDYQAPYYYLKTDTSRKEPFCSNCFESDHKLIHLHTTNQGDNQACPRCKKAFSQKGHVYTVSKERF